MENRVMDAYAWIEYFRGSEEGERVREYVDGEGRLLTPSIVVAELSDKYRGEGLEDDWEIRRHFVRMKSEVLDLGYETAEEAGRLKQELRERHDDAGLADAIILSHARQEESQVLTGDRHLVHREEVEDISG